MPCPVPKDARAHAHHRTRTPCAHQSGQHPLCSCSAPPRGAPPTPAPHPHPHPPAQDLLVASLFRNFLLAERIMTASNCTPVSFPRLPPTHNHSMWQVRARARHPWSGQCAWEEGGLWPHMCMAGGGCSWLPSLTSGGGGATGAHTYMPSFGAHSPLTYPLPRTDVRAHP